ncbi:EutP/PduV family microcompartment system protein [Buttiauxella noackiae]|uniref:EutP/PduV family microcompartment system protein n=1 Tax=Buttiauxella noackiae TaxID=82992 RepID=UPI0035A5EB93
MKRIMLIGPSQCGKTSLTQRLHGEAIRYQKTQAIEWSPTAIDTPGEYLENRRLYSALLASANEADVIALVLAATAEICPFSPGFTLPMNRPTIGIVTKSDLADATAIEQSLAWLTESGAQRCFITSSQTGAGINDVISFLSHKELLCPTL